MNFNKYPQKNMTSSLPGLINNIRNVAVCGLMLTVFYFSFLPAQDTLVTDSQGKPIPNFLQRKISIEFENLQLSDALSEFAIHTKFYLNYNENIIPLDHYISVKLNEVPAVIILQKLLEVLASTSLFQNQDRLSW